LNIVTANDLFEPVPCECVSFIKDTPAYRDALENGLAPPQNCFCIQMVMFKMSVEEILKSKTPRLFDSSVLHFKNPSPFTCFVNHISSKPTESTKTDVQSQLNYDQSVKNIKSLIAPASRKSERFICLQFDEMIDLDTAVAGLEQFMSVEIDYDYLEYASEHVHSIWKEYCAVSPEKRGDGPFRRGNLLNASIFIDCTTVVDENKGICLLKFES
jgi:hypothetical protein